MTRLCAQLCRDHFSLHDVAHRHIQIGNAPGDTQQALRRTQIGINITPVQFARTEVKQGADAEHFAAALRRLHAKPVAENGAEILGQFDADQRVTGFDHQNARLDLVVEPDHTKITIQFGADNHHRTRSLTLDAQPRSCCYGRHRNHTFGGFRCARQCRPAVDGGQSLRPRLNRRQS